MIKNNTKLATHTANIDLIKNDLVIDSFGNASSRLNGKTFFIKPSGVNLEDISFEDISEVQIQSGKRISGRAPSSDTPTHLELYKTFENIGGVVHTHSLYATAWAQAKVPIPCLGTTHADYWNDKIHVTRDLKKDEINSDYEKETGKVIIEKLSELKADPLEYPGMLVANHGPFTWGKNIFDAVKNAIRLEYIAKLAFLSLSINPNLGVLSKSMINKHFFRKHGPDAYYGQDKD